MARKKAVCKRVSDALSVIARGTKGVSSLSPNIRDHIRRCKDCNRRHTALLHALVDWAESRPPDPKKRESVLAYQLASRLVAAAYFVAFPQVFALLVKNEFFLLHDVIAEITAAGAGKVLPLLPSVLREVAQAKKKCFAVPRA